MGQQYLLVFLIYRKVKKTTMAKNYITPKLRYKLVSCKNKSHDGYQLYNNVSKLMVQSVNHQHQDYDLQNITGLSPASGLCLLPFVSSVQLTVYQFAVLFHLNVNKTCLHGQILHCIR